MHLQFQFRNKVNAKKRICTSAMWKKQETVIMNSTTEDQLSIGNYIIFTKNFRNHSYDHSLYSYEYS